MDDIVEKKKVLRNLMQTQGLAVLATHQDGQPYVSLMGFVATDDLKYLILTTSRATRKYANLIANPQVALMIDNRSNSETDFNEAIAVTVIGQAREVNADERDGFLRLYLAKHDSLRDFSALAATALFVVEVETYYIVNQFQNVSELRMGVPSEHA